MGVKTTRSIGEPVATFDSWASDSVELLEEVEQQLIGLNALMKREGFRTDPEGRRLAATARRYQRVSQLLRAQISETQDHARKCATLRRLGRRREKTKV